MSENGGEINKSSLFQWTLNYRIRISYDLFIYLGLCVTFNTVQVISRQVVGRAEETSTYSSSGFCTVNYRPMASNYQLSHLRPCREPNPGLRGGRARVLPLCHRCPQNILWIRMFKWIWTLDLKRINAQAIWRQNVVHNEKLLLIWCQIIRVTSS